VADNDEAEVADVDANVPAGEVVKAKADEDTDVDANADADDAAGVGSGGGGGGDWGMVVNAVVDQGE
jgi:hypothetical protein